LAARAQRVALENDLFGLSGAEAAKETLVRETVVAQRAPHAARDEDVLDLLAVSTAEAAKKKAKEAHACDAEAQRAERDKEECATFDAFQQLSLNNDDFDEITYVAVLWVKPQFLFDSPFFLVVAQADRERVARQGRGQGQGRGRQG
jgi:hypothetical protein